ncbi:hypothetical protein [Streptomyces sp. NPDC049879]|uniref:Imm32 family immunity protein n=1 Tax=Streptomyces sp. NPDC049879 TaxID=3365598 RepID=UPI00379FFF15
MASALNGGDSSARDETMVVVEVAPYEPAAGVSTWWDDGAILRAEVWDDPEKVVVISGNPAGLRSLARHLLTLAQQAMPGGRHLDFDSYSGSLAEESLAIRLEVEKQ